MAMIIFIFAGKIIFYPKIKIAGSKSLQIPGSRNGRKSALFIQEILTYRAESIY